LSVHEKKKSGAHQLFLSHCAKFSFLPSFFLSKKKKAARICKYSFKKIQIMGVKLKISGFKPTPTFQKLAFT